MIPVVTILLSTFNGASWLPAQLDSLQAQTHPWSLLWRDDGSSDDTAALMRASAGHEAATPGRLGVLGSFMALLREAAADLPADGLIAFCDQDDVWLPDKLARGVAAAAGNAPILYSARQILVDESLQPLGESQRVRRAGFPAALTGNICTGCTIVMNRAAARLVADSRPPASSIHDWWSYLVVAAAGGRIVCDEAATVLYRQHGGNAVGAPATRARRAIAALRRGPRRFTSIMRDHVAALRAHDEILSPSARDDLAAVDAALRDGLARRVAALMRPGLSRQTPLDTAVFRLWFLMA